VEVGDVRPLIPTTTTGYHGNIWSEGNIYIGGAYEDSYIVNRYGFGAITQSYPISIGSVVFNINVDGVGRVVSVT